MRVTYSTIRKGEEVMIKDIYEDDISVKDFPYIMVDDRLALRIDENNLPETKELDLIVSAMIDEMIAEMRAKSIND